MILLMNAKWFGKQNLEIRGCSGKSSLFPLIRLHSGSSASEDTDPGLSPETRSAHHSSTPHPKHTVVFSVTLCSLLLHLLIFTTYSTGPFTGKAVCDASLALGCAFVLHKDTLLSLSACRLLWQGCRSSISESLIGNFRREQAEHPSLQKQPPGKPNTRK